ncbi:hypothetical protein AADEFJLK_04127 [Methylovulum psychrotolerans]|uniref:Uncharacterized protein n=1 Tax=Methylovulum psychrotolerans TaxID=1704499 RepID=A0A2S5CH22_9GAMM|nr:hypothetical protein AADEFJLK_04127 [Methylovulum psychrotolerans]
MHLTEKPSLVFSTSVATVTLSSVACNINISDVSPFSFFSIAVIKLLFNELVLIKVVVNFMVLSMMSTQLIFGIKDNTKGISFENSFKPILAISFCSAVSNK